MGFAQSNLLWKGYFSYNEIKDLTESPTTVFAASENALFSKNTTTNLIKTTNTIDGLSGQTISSLYYSSSVNKTIVGYENGLLIVVNEADGSMLKVVDIINKELPPNLKKINYFMEFEGMIYVSCDFGIVQFNLNTMQFGDTYFIGDNGAEIRINQTAIFDGFIYAATTNGIRRGRIANQNLIDFNQWETIAVGSWSNIEVFSGELLAVNTSGFIHKFNAISNSFVGLMGLSQEVLDMRAKENNLIVTTSNAVFVYNSQMALVRQINSSGVMESTLFFTCATQIGDVLFIGTKENGLFTTTISSTTPFENTTPIGPLRNNVFSIQTTSSALWAVFGGYSGDYNPDTYSGKVAPTVAEV